MLGHIGINVPDLTAAKSYYDEIMPLLGFESFLSHDDEFAYKPAAGKRGTFLFIYPSQQPGEFSRMRTGLQHLAFMMPTRSSVRAIVTTIVSVASTTPSSKQHASCTRR